MGRLIPFKRRPGRSFHYVQPSRPVRRSSFLASIRRNFGFLALLAAGLVFVAYEDRFTVRSVPQTGGFRAIDGDSLRRGGKNYRLKGIDAPELHQTCEDARGASYNCGQDAHRELARLMFGVSVSCDVRDTDRYGRGLVYCRAGETDINELMVKAGWAISYRNFRYLVTEIEARREGRGLWRGTFENPEAWRARHRDKLARGGMAATDSDLPD